MKVDRILYFLFFLSSISGCNCEGPKETYTIQGRLQSSGIPVEEHRLEFYRVYNITGIVKYEFLGTVTPQSTGDYEFSYSTNKDGAHLMVDLLINENQNVMKFIFPFNEDVNQDLDISERRNIVLRLKSDNEVKEGDTLRLRISNYFPYYFGFAFVGVDELRLAGPLNSDQMLEWYALNGQTKYISMMEFTTDTFYDRGDYRFPLATELNLDTIEINY